MSLYAQYITERTNDHILEQEDDGYATYRYMDDGRAVYIMDIYVVPEKRRAGVATKLADEIAYMAKSKGCTEMLGSVVPSTKYSTRSLKVLISYGMKLQSSTNDFILLRKDI